MMPAKVSVVVPCYNSARYIEDSLHSVCRQTYPHLEILAVNDGSHDATQAHLDRLAKEDNRIRLFMQQNAGPSAARNTGMRNVTGEYVCFLDADDVMLPEKLERQSAFLDQHPEVDLVYSDFYTGDAELNLTALTAVRVSREDMLETIAMHNYFPPTVPMFRRHRMETVGPFDEGLRMAEDWDYWIRWAKVATFGYLPCATTIYRAHPAQAHRDLPKMLLGGKKVLRKHFKTDGVRHHRALASWYEANAKLRWAANQRFATGLLLAISALHNTASSMAGAFRRPTRSAAANRAAYGANSPSVKSPGIEN